MSFWFKKPPPVQFVGDYGSTASATPVFTNYKTNDIIVAASIINTGTTVPAIPSGVGWTGIGSSSGNSCAAQTGWRRCASDGADGGLGTWGSTVAYASYRNVDKYDPIGVQACNNAASAASVVNPALTLEGKNSLVVAGAAVRANNSVLRAGLTLSSERVSSGIRYRWGYSAPVKTWAADTVANDTGNTSGHNVFAFEVKGRRR